MKSLALPLFSVNDSLGFLLGDYVQVHQVCGSGSLTRSNYDAENILGLE